jgi:hypothetical protein
MSAMLLMDSKPPIHTLADDLESFLHVLSWVMLRYTPHDLDSETLTDFLIDMFDHSYEGENRSARGGRSKMAYLMSGLVPKSGFRHPLLPALLKELTETCAVRYEERPPDETDNVDEEENQLNALLRKKYEQRLAALGSSDWMLETFRKALDGGGWPENDESRPNRLAAREIRGRKRKPADEVSRVPQQRMRFASPVPDLDGEGN